MEMTRLNLPALVEMIGESATTLTRQRNCYDPLIELVGPAPLVLLGEATHGSHEFYRARAEITARLIAEKDFAAVAVEADWPDAYRVNRFVRGAGHDSSPADCLGDFKRFPTWMWRNSDVVEFVAWLAGHNSSQSPGRRVGFYGLDLYSLYGSIDKVIAYLDRVDPAEADRARRRYGCLDHVGQDPQAYGYGVSTGLRASCEDEVVAQLLALREQGLEALRRDGMAAEDEQFQAERNAALVRDAEQYYRRMFNWSANTWNLRDRHMAETLAALREHLRRTGRPDKIVVWAHNSHIGDARATEMSRRGEWNVGQLVRQQVGRDVVLVGLTTFDGTVSAASGWDEPVERKQVRPALPESVEWLFHQAVRDVHGDRPGRGGNMLLRLDHGPLVDELRAARLQRAIGVVYLPQTERASHYFNCRLSEQFDAVLHFDRSWAVEPLERTARWEAGEGPEQTFPTGL